jgi:hypothetical protein
MAVYSIMLPDSTILKRVAGVKSALIVGCKECVNDSLAFGTEKATCESLQDCVSHEDTRHIPVNQIP